MQENTSDLVLVYIWLVEIVVIEEKWGKTKVLLSITSDTLLKIALKSDERT